MQTLEENIKTELSKQKGVFALYYKNLQNGETLGINDREVFHAASTMKTPVMMEVYKQAFAGRFSMNDSLLLKNLRALLMEAFIVLMQQMTVS
jgi:beta-lactamase class A